jgi:hypothetical protein
MEIRTMMGKIMKRTKKITNNIRMTILNISLSISNCIRIDLSILEIRIVLDVIKYLLSEFNFIESFVDINKNSVNYQCSININSDNITQEYYF